jgi:hypothetical protein
MSKVIGYTIHESGTYMSLHAPQKESIVTHSFLLCKKCNSVIYHCMGPRYDVICLNCFRLTKQEEYNV